MTRIAKTTMYMIAKKYDWEADYNYKFICWNPEDCSDSTYISVKDGNGVPITVDLEMEVPAGFDPRTGEIDRIDEEIKELRAQFSNKLANLEEQRSKLLALDYIPAGESEIG